MPITLDDLLEFHRKKIGDIDGRLVGFEDLLDTLSDRYKKDVVDKLLLELDIKDGNILPTEANIKKISRLDRYFSDFMQSQGSKMVIKMTQDMSAVLRQNATYFRKVDANRINDEQVRRTIFNRLGLTETGTVKSKGFLGGLLTDTTVKDDVSKYLESQILQGNGFDAVKKGLADMVAGTPEKMGNFKTYYRNIAYDTYTRIDAASSKLHADKLKMDYFIYSGTKRKASRHFCLERKGKVYSRAEAEEWRKLIGKTTTVGGKAVKIGPMVTKGEEDQYNPLVDRGGYGCVDDIMWIPKEIAFKKRPELIPSSAVSIKDKIDALAELSATENRNTGYGDRNIYRDFEARSISETKTSEELRKLVGRPILISKIYGQASLDSMPREVSLLVRDYGKTALDKLFETKNSTKASASDITFSQRYVFEKPIVNSKGVKDGYVIRTKDGRLILIDGNHATAKRFLEGKDLFFKIVDESELE